MNQVKISNSTLNELASFTSRAWREDDIEHNANL